MSRNRPVAVDNYSRLIVGGFNDCSLDVVRKGNWFWLTITGWFGFSKAVKLNSNQLRTLRDFLNELMGEEA